MKIFDKHPKICVYGLFPLPLWILFAFFVQERNSDKRVANKSTINTEIKVLQGDSTIDDPFAYFDDKEQNQTTKIDYSGNMDMGALKEKNKQDYEQILQDDRSIIEEQNKALYARYEPPKRQSSTSYDANEIVNRRKKEYIAQDEINYGRGNSSQVAKSESLFNTSKSSFNSTSSSNVSIPKTDKLKPVKIMAVQSSTYKNGNSIKFKLLEAYKEFPKGTTILGNIKLNREIATVVFSGAQLGEDENLELYSLSMDRGIPLQSINQDVQDIKDDVRSSSSGTVGEIVRSVPVLGPTAERVINRMGNRSKTSVGEVQIMGGEKYYLVK